VGRTRRSSRSIGDASTTGRPDFTPYYEELAGRPEIAADGTAPGDILVGLD
jgi:hypothetical protein